MADDSIEHALAQASGLHRIGQLGRLPDVPQAQIRRSADSNTPQFGQPQSAGAMCGHAGQGLARRETEQGAGQVRHQRGHADRRSSGVCIAGHGHGHAMLAQQVDRGQLGFTQYLEGTRQ